MSARRGYYSLVQFCPHPARAEAVNLGVVLFCPDAGFIAARTLQGNRPAEKLVGREGVDKAALDAAKRAIEGRLDVERSSFQTLEDFQRFVDSRANVLKLTAPRPLKVLDPAEDLGRLFDELVGGKAHRVQRTPVFPPLDDLFHRLERAGRAQLNLTLNVPVLERPLRVPYAYRNGDLNLVKPHKFSAQEGEAMKAAVSLAVQGDLLQRHLPYQEDRKHHLTVVPSFETSGDGQWARTHVCRVLEEYQVKVVPEDRIPAFVANVEQEAH